MRLGAHETAGCRGMMSSTVDAFLGHARLDGQQAAPLFQQTHWLTMLKGLSRERGRRQGGERTKEQETRDV